MAKGGWSYSGVILGPHAYTTPLWEADWNAVSDALVALGVGWSVATGNALFLTSGATSAWWRSWNHTSGAKLIMEVTPYNGANSITPLHADNSISGVNLTGYCGDHVSFAYLPPGHSGLGGGTPATSGFIPNTGFKFGYTGYDVVNLQIMDFSLQTTAAMGSNAFHFVGKDDDLFILAESSSHTSRGFDFFWGMGTLFGTLAHPSEETDSDISKEAFIGSLYGVSGLSSADSPYSFFRTPSVDGARGTTRPRVRGDGLGLTSLSTGLATTIHSVPELGTEPWVSPYMYYSGTGVSTEGVIAGNGMKGVLDPDKIRQVQGWSMSQRQTLDGGNFLYIGGGIAIGWDPGNGAMI